MSDEYTTVDWENYPSRKTPITAENLRHMDNQIKLNSDAINSSVAWKIVNGKICIAVEEEEN